MPSKKRLISVALLSILTMTKLAGAVPADDGERILYSFAGGTSDGSEPLSGLLLDAAANFYGTTFHGGNYNTGTVFELQPDGNGGWTETVLHRFAPHNGDGYSAESVLTLDAAGNLYGTTAGGGTYDYGTVFELKRQASGHWKVKVLHSFNFNGTDGVSPPAGLVRDAAGNLYGVTSGGGSARRGTLFELKRQANGAWIEKVLYSFKNNAAAGTFLLEN